MSIKKDPLRLVKDLEQQTGRYTLFTGAVLGVAAVLDETGRTAADPRFRRFADELREAAVRWGGPTPPAELRAQPSLPTRTPRQAAAPATEPPDEPRPEISMPRLHGCE